MNQLYAVVVESEAFPSDATCHDSATPKWLNEL